MSSADLKKVCAICGRDIPNDEDLYEDLDKLQNVWTFHKNCLNRFSNRDFKNKKVK